MDIDKLEIAARFAVEAAKWVKAGRPYRDEEKIKEIYQICSDCEHYKPQSPGRGECGICGCKLRAESIMLNKIAWATTRCPLEQPKWEESSEEYKDIEISKKEVQPPPPQNPVKKRTCCGG